MNSNNENGHKSWRDIEVPYNAFVYKILLIWFVVVALGSLVFTGFDR